METIKMAWRNIWRNKARSGAVSMAVILGIAAGIFASSLVEGVMRSRFVNFIENQVSHIQVQHPEFIREQEVFQTIPVDRHRLSEIQTHHQVRGATVRTRSQSMIASATYTGGISLVGILPQSEHQTTAFADKLVMGEYLPDDHDNSILIGASMATKMKVSVGSRIVLSFQDKDNELVSAAFVVRGLFDTGYKRYDESTAFVHLHHISDYLKVAPYFHELAVLAHDPDSLHAVVADLQPFFPGMSVRQWQEIAPELEMMMASSGIFSYIFIILILIGLAFGLLNTMLMAVFERTREIGMLMAIGMNKRRLFALIVSETALLSLFGTAIGLILAIWLVNWTGRSGIDLSAFSDVMKELGVDPVIYPMLDASFVWVLPWIVLTISILAALYPALKALKLKPAEAIGK
jgi:ABC-type lipoprotein release transport system permease subunit